MRIVALQKVLHGGGISGREKRQQTEVERFETCVNGIKSQSNGV